MVDTLVDEAEDARSRLVRATAELIHAKSYGAVGVQAICDAADVRKGSFYHFFDSKQALVLAALDDMWAAFLREGLEPSFAPDKMPRERIEAMFTYAEQTHTAMQRQNGHVLGCVFGNLAAEASTLDEPIRSRVLQAFAEWATMIEATIAEAIDQGELDPVLSPQITSWSLLSTLQGALLVAKAANDTACIPGIGEEAVATLWGGVVP